MSNAPAITRVLWPGGYQPDVEVDWLAISAGKNRLQDGSRM